VAIRDDLNYGLAAFGIQIPERFDFDEFLSSKLLSRPATSAAVVVLAGGLLMHHFEKDQNPKMRDVYDALLYCATSLNVGYADHHPVTRAGKLLASVLHTYGPALATRTLDGKQLTPHGDSCDISSLMKQLLAKMEITAERDST
jgi:hypothetical protein